MKTEAQKKPKAWARAGIEQIQKEGDVRAQLKAAEDYYGKAVVLFLASLTSRLEGSQKPAHLGEPIIKEIKEPQESITKDERDMLASVTSSKSDVKVNAEAVNVNAKDKALSQLISYKRSAVATKMTPQVRKMNGVFEGTFKWQGKKNKGRVDTVFMDMNFSMEENSLHGSALIVMTDPSGKAYSNSRNNGKNQTLRLVQGRRDQIYIEPAPGDFILMDISRGNRLTGKYFDSDGIYLGDINLSKR
ncbi:MAG: hypothetical protein K2P81_02520 [Bacteriovoracaceae bacterium]|nr:hypothetical protein [Bacteriovoracaceae bacterium]